MDQRFIRTGLLLGEEALKRLRGARVAVFGLGGVGAYAVEALARSGVGFFRLVDFDNVKQSNFNRQLIALEHTVGRPKVDVVKERIAQINPSCEVDTRAVFVDEASLDTLLDGTFDVGIDAIDSVSSKTALLAAFVHRSIPAVTCMGAAARIDPLSVRTGDINESHTCPLARIIRKRLHRRGVYTGIHCVYSVEPVDTSKVAQFDEEESFDRGRRRPSLGSISYMPGIMGLTVASEAIGCIIGNSNERGLRAGGLLSTAPEPVGLQE
jgi:tRNA threonylcarbamoyladenosine dehydratase